MICPKCGQHPLTFTRLLTTLNPMRIDCRSCGAKLRATSAAWVWTALHVPLGVAIALGAGAIRTSERFAGDQWFATYLLGAAILLFVTAYVIPWYWRGSLYRLET